MNNGLLPVICDTAHIREGDQLRIENAVVNETTGERIAAEPLPDVMLRIIDAGGLVAYFRRYGGFAGA